MIMGTASSDIADGRRARAGYLAVTWPAPQATKGGMKSLNDGVDWAAVMRRVSQGDRAAFAALYGHFAPRVKFFLMKSGTPAAMAEDCAQDVLATVWQKAGMFDASRASVATWVFTIARNRRIDLARRDRRPEPEDVEWMGADNMAPDQSDLFEAEEESHVLSQALATLPEKQRALIQRAYYGDLTHSEIAAETGLPLGTIKSRIRLALDKLRLKLSETKE